VCESGFEEKGVRVLEFGRTRKRGKREQLLHLIGLDSVQIWRIQRQQRFAAIRGPRPQFIAINSKQ